MLIRCGGCNRKLQVEDKLAGQFGACPACKNVIKMPRVEDVANQKPGDPPLAAEAIPQDELERMLPGATIVVDEPAASEPGTPGGGAEASDAVETDEDGYVLAVPVEENEAGSLTEIPEQGVGIQPPAGSDEGGYALAGDEEGGASSAPSGGKGDDLTDGLDEVFWETERQQAASGAEEKIVTRCPGCKGLLAIESQYAGKMRTCPKCATEVQVPLESDVVIPEAKEPPPAGATEGYITPPSALAEDLSSDVDIEDYVVGGSSSGSRGVAPHWVVSAFVVGALVGFAVGWIVSGMRARPGLPAVDQGLPAGFEPAPPGEASPGP